MDAVSGQVASDISPLRNLGYLGLSPSHSPRGKLVCQLRLGADAHALVSEPSTSSVIAKKTHTYFFHRRTRS
jgi:hypothetical protein